MSRLLGFSLALVLGGCDQTTMDGVCREQVLRFDNVQRIECSSPDHTMLRGDDEGTFWICTCDPTGGPRARLRWVKYDASQ